MPHPCRPTHFLACAAVVLAAACGGGGGDEPHATVATLAAEGSGTITGFAGQTIGPVAVRATDAQGRAVAGVVIGWSASAGTVSPTTSTTNAAGVATTTWTLGTTAGSQTLTAIASGGVTRTLIAAVAPDRATTVTITGVDVDTLRPGRTVTITGAGFAPNATSVVVGGRAATVTSATATQLVARLAPASDYACDQPMQTTVIVRRVVAAETTATDRSFPFDGGTHLALDVGQRAVATDAASVSCLRLDRAGSYVVSVFNTATTVPGGVAVQLQGMTTRGAAARAVRAMRAMRAMRAPSAERVPGARATHLRPDSSADAHLRHLDRERARLSTLRAPPPARAPGGSASRAAVPAVGDVVTLNAMYFDCAAPTAIRARVAAVGTRSVVLEDVAVPGGGANDALYRQLADEFDRVVYPLITQHFGDPLALDATFGGDGHVRMLFTPYVGDSVPNTIGFMTGCNFAARGQLPASNQAAVFYARLPKPNETAAEWRYNLRATIVHETKHLAAYAERFARAGAGPPVLEETWLEEATARVAEELYARTFSGATWKGNATYAPTVGCELTRCDDRPLGVYKHFEAVADFYSRVDSLTPLGGVSRFDGTYYGSGWLLTRWAADRFAADEPSFFRALTTETGATGLQNLARRTGRAPEAMLPDWALAMAVDDRPGFTPALAELSIPSWNTRDIFRGLNAAVPFQFRAPFPLLVRRLTPGSFTVDVPLLRSYTSAFAELTAAPAGQLLWVRAPDAAAAPAGVGLAVVRVP